MQFLKLRDMARFAVYAAAADMEASFRRTLLGPLWSTLGLTLLIASLGLFFGSVLKEQLPNLDVYVPFVAAGMIVWSFWANCVYQSCSQIWGFLNSLRHNSMTLFVPVLRVMVRNLVLLTLNLSLAILVAWLYFGRLSIAPASLICGLILLIINTLWMSYLAALVCARFRDLPQLIAWGIHLAFFLTPILWIDYNLGRFEYLLHYNLFATLIALVRLPLLGQPVPMEVWIVATLLAVGGMVLCIWLGRRSADRLPYWL